MLSVAPSRNCLLDSVTSELVPALHMLLSLPIEDLSKQSYVTDCLRSISSISDQSTSATLAATNQSAGMSRIVLALGIVRIALTC